jgi:hypothetical protein
VQLVARDINGEHATKHGFCLTKPIDESGPIKRCGAAGVTRDVSDSGADTES